jgi:hypothetical protein
MSTPTPPYTDPNFDWAAVAPEDVTPEMRPYLNARLDEARRDLRAFTDAVRATADERKARRERKDEAA